MTHPISDSRMRALSELVRSTIGLSFPRERWSDLLRGLDSAKEALGFSAVEPCAEWLLTAGISEKHAFTLAGHLTIGETYFFREPILFQVLGQVLLPRLVQANTGKKNRLQFWSAGCSSGEEPYTLAIVLQEFCANNLGWQAQILASDINLTFLEKARRGEYRQWSFRDVPESIRRDHFEPISRDTWRIADSIKTQVRFFQHNLTSNETPWSETEAAQCDIILCRNVLMYFSPETIEKILELFYQCLAPSGYLCVSATEYFLLNRMPFIPERHDTITVFRKATDIERAAVARLAPSAFSPSWSVLRRPETPTRNTPPGMAARGGESVPTELPRWFEPPRPTGPAPASLATTPPHPTSPSIKAGTSPTALATSTQNTETSPAQPDETPRAVTPTPDLIATATAFFEQGHYQRLTEFLLSENPALLKDAQAMNLLAMTFANQGRLDQAREWCEKAIARNGTNPAHHYVLGTILTETGHFRDAAASFTRAIYFDPGFVLAHIALGAAARAQGKHEQAARHFHHALQLLEPLADTVVLPQAKGLSCATLREMIKSMTRKGPEKS